MGTDPFFGLAISMPDNLPDRQYAILSSLTAVSFLPYHPDPNCVYI